MNIRRVAEAHTNKSVNTNATARLGSRSRRVRYAAAFAVPVLTLAACSGNADDGGENAGGGGDEPITLVFRQQDPDAQSVGVPEMVDRWNEENPDVQVELQHVSWQDAHEQFIREVQAQEGPDVLHLGFVWTSSLADSGLLTPLDDYVEENPPGDGLDDFIGTDLQTVDGSVYALPWTVDTGTLVYRADILEEAGVSDFAPASWEDLQSTAADLASGNDDLTAGYCFNAADAWFQFNAYLWSNGETLVRMEGDTPEVAISQEALTEAIEYFNGFFTSGATPSSYVAVQEYGDPVMLGALQRGDCAISFLPIAPYRNLVSDNPDLDLASTAMPEGSEGMTSYLGGRALGISAASEHPDEAYEFAVWMTQEQLFDELEYPWWPAQTSLVDAMEFPEEEEGFQEVLPEARTFADYVETGLPVDGINNMVSQELSGVFSGGASAEDAAANIIANLEGQIQDQ